MYKKDLPMLFIDLSYSLKAVLCFIIALTGDLKINNKKTTGILFK